MLPVWQTIFGRIVPAGTIYTSSLRYGQTKRSTFAILPKVFQCCMILKLLADLFSVHFIHYILRVFTLINLILQYQIRHLILNLSCNMWLYFNLTRFVFTKSSKREEKYFNHLDVNTISKSTSDVYAQESKLGFNANKSKYYSYDSERTSDHFVYFRTKLSIQGTKFISPEKDAVQL